MAVVERKRKGGSVFFAVNVWQRRQISERVGTSRREAEARDRAMKREIAAGTYRPPSETRALTIGEYATAWGTTRTNAYGSDERGIIRKHIADAASAIAELRLDEATPTQVARWVEALKRKPGRKGATMSDKTVGNIVGVLHQIFEQAIREDRCIRNPVNLAPGTLDRRAEEEVEPYTLAEALVLTRHAKIPWPVRVLTALCVFGGLRKGEACGRRWRDLDDAPKPLPSLYVKSQYEGRRLKTKRYRVVPVHPELGRVLMAWAESGFELYTGRKPSPEDFIVPNASARAVAESHTESSYYKLFTRSAKKAGIPIRTVHATRHTFISLCRRGGARPDVLERVTHNSSGAIIDRYTHFDWQPLCEAVLCLRLDAHPELHSPEGSPGDSGGNHPAPGGTLPNEYASLPSSASASIPDASTTNQHESCWFEKQRQATRQEFERNGGEFSDDEAAGLFAVALTEDGERAAAYELAARPIAKAPAGLIDDDSEVASG